MDWKERDRITAKMFEGKEGRSEDIVPPPGWYKYVLFSATGFILFAAWDLFNGNFRQMFIDIALAVGIYVCCFLYRRRQIHNHILKGIEREREPAGRP